VETIGSQSRWTAQELVEFRHKFGFTQKQLAERLGVTVKTIKWMEWGKRSITTRTAGQLLEIGAAALHDKAERRTIQSLGANPGDALAALRSMMGAPNPPAGYQSVPVPDLEDVVHLPSVVLRAFSDEPAQTPGERTSEERGWIIAEIRRLGFVFFVCGRDPIATVLAAEVGKIIDQLKNDKTFPPPSQIRHVKASLSALRGMAIKWIDWNNAQHPDPKDVLHIKVDGGNATGRVATAAKGKGRKR
jgi:DNA-binding XRE family transcriptional regulator